MRDINLIIIHCAATPPEMDIGAHEIDQWHKERGWSGIGYHYVLRRGGQIEKGRTESQVGIHASGYNKNSIGVCLVGGSKRVRDKSGKVVLAPQNNFTDLQWQTLEKIIIDLLKKYPNATVIGHRDVAIKDCPTFSVRDWLENNKIYDKAGLKPKSFTQFKSKPVINSRSAVGATVAGTAGTAAVILDNGAEIAEAAHGLTSLTEPGTFLSILLILIILGGTGYSIYGRYKVKKQIDGEMTD